MREEVRGACELLGLDPLYVANEGKMIAIVEARAAERVVEAMRAHEYGSEARVIGTVVDQAPRNRGDEDDFWNDAHRRYAGGRSTTKDLLNARTRHSELRSSKP